MRTVSIWLAAGATALALAGPAGAQQLDAKQAEAVMAKAGCNACHAVDKKGVGPSYREVAAKRKGDPKAAETLIQKVRAGGAGVYGQVPMPPNPPGKILAL
jgi:cytochrome c